MKHYGLIGCPLGHSFSKQYFTEKFKENGTDAVYELHELPEIECFEELLDSCVMSGLNVTIPYKQSIVAYLDELDETARLVGAVNTIQFLPDGRLKGYNTDVIGFEETLKPLLRPCHRKALILGTGGASKAVAFVLSRLGIAYTFVSRKKSAESLCYNDLSQEILEDNLLIVNTTPLGMFPNVHEKPQIPYQFLTENHLLYDLIYNPLKTEFLRKGEEAGATIQNGLAMLQTQAEASYKIWQMTTK